MTRLADIKIPLTEGVWLLLAPASEAEPELGMLPLPFLPAGWQGKVGTAASPIVYDPSATANGMHPLAVVEVAAFHWELLVDAAHPVEQIALRSSLSGSVAQNQWHERRTSGRIHGDFRF